MFYNISEIKRKIELNCYVYTDKFLYNLMDEVINYELFHFNDIFDSCICTE